MAPLTRGHRARAEKTGESIEPLSPVLTAHTLTPTRPAGRNHLRFDNEDTQTVTWRGDIDANDTSSIQINSHPVDEIADSQDDPDSDSDGDAPEAVSMGAGKQAAEKREEETRKAAEAQKEAVRKKRKERDTKLKEQKAEAEARKESKRRKLDDAETVIAPQPTLKVAVTEGDESIINATIEKPKTPLLPEPLLAEVSACPEVVDDSEDSEKDIGDTKVTPKVLSAKLEKNRRRREQKKRNKVLKKGVVNVKVLKDEAASRKVMAPPASKRVENIKKTWLFERKGVFERRSVGGGFVKRK